MTATLADALGDVERVGHAFLPSWLFAESTEVAAATAGDLVNIEAQLPGSGIGTVQTLQPRRQAEAPRNQYSGTFGLGEFPLHTDLAHWARPPRYLMLRCVVGEPDVETLVLPVTAIENVVGASTLRRALVRPRSPGRTGAHVLLNLCFSEGTHRGTRWDSLFLRPMNDASRRVANALEVTNWKDRGLVQFALTQPGDTLIIDNWRCLHGRSAVRSSATARRIERAYLATIRP